MPMPMENPNSQYIYIYIYRLEEGDGESDRGKGQRKQMVKVTEERDKRKRQRKGIKERTNDRDKGKRQRKWSKEGDKGKGRRKGKDTLATCQQRRCPSMPPGCPKGGGWVWWKHGSCAAKDSGCPHKHDQRPGQTKSSATAAAGPPNGTRKREGC